jgi:hypothetical protein
MARVALITAAATYQGELDLSFPGGQPMRFLDALNFPHRVARGGTQATPLLVLRDAVRRDDATGAVIPCGPEITLHPANILAGYEVGGENARGSGYAVAVYEQRQHAGETARSLIFLDNGMRVVGVVSGGPHALDGARPAGRGDFVACLDVQLLGRGGGAPRQLAFVAVNVRRVEATGDAVSAGLEASGAAR